MNMPSFTHSAGASRIVFGRGSLSQVRGEVERLDRRRALVLTTPQQRALGSDVLDDLGAKGAGLFSGAAVHTPVEVTYQAVVALEEARADVVVAIGGGSTTGLGKAIASRTGVDQVVVPTTYAGSEVTPILGETVDGVKSTRRGPEILPEAVIYDPMLTDSLPLALTVTSGLNALAHAVESLYARDRSPLHRLMATEAIGAFRTALPILVGEPTDSAARERALYAAWLSGSVLGSVEMSVHHKLCHTLGGALGLPHAETHAILLPHTIAFVETSASSELAPVRRAFGDRGGAGLWDFAVDLGAPRSLAGLGVAEEELDRVADLAMANPYWSPRPLGRSDVVTILRDAWSGARPA